MNRDLWDEYLAKYERREISKATFAKALGISRPTLDKRLKEYNEGVEIYKH